ncbi:MAG: hypothetical protein EHM41_17575 [Chloroflexi bacterium]|nr:MAG: hypothetical protein EHM41_17575 [Chloroflexota bacterium]
MFQSKKFLVISFVFILFLILLAACNLPSNQPQVTEEPNLVYTAAAQTVAAQLTQAISGQVPTQQPTQGTNPTATQQAPTATQAVPTATTAAPTATSVPPTATPTQVPCNLMEFVKDVNYPDDTEVQPGTTIDKTWRLKNIGSCSWSSSYSLVFDSGDAMSAPASVQMTNGQVPPGSTVDVTVRMKAPDGAGTYQGNWKVRDGSGNVFGYAPNNKAFWVKVKVAAVVNYSFIGQASNAEWRNGTTLLPYGDSDNDAPGVAVVLDGAKLENDKTYDDVLATYPERIDNGTISGLFGKIVVKNNDHFRAEIGLRTPCTNGKVKFQLYYRKSGVLTLLKEWVKSCDGSLLSVDVDLDSLEGQEVNFMLAVTTEGAWDNDKAIWVNPRIQEG